MSTSNNPQESLYRATSGESQTNYATIIRGFVAKGIPEAEIIPRVNVLTYNAWQAKGRTVKRGERGVRCLTYIESRDKQTDRTSRRPWSATVFHISQTAPTDGQAIVPTAPQAVVETRSDAAIVAQAKGKAFVELTADELRAMLRQMEAAQATPPPILYPDAATDTPDSWRNDPKTIDVQPIPPTARLVKTKAAWIREAGYPVGQPAPMHLNCECGRTVRAEAMGEVTCHCGIHYDRSGWITRPEPDTQRAERLAEFDRKHAGEPASILDAPTRRHEVQPMTPRERVAAGIPVNMMDLLPDKIDARPGQPQPLKPAVKRRSFEF